MVVPVEIAQPAQQGAPVTRDTRGRGFERNGRSEGMRVDEVQQLNKHRWATAEDLSPSPRTRLLGLPPSPTKIHSRPPIESSASVDTSKPASGVSAPSARVLPHRSPAAQECRGRGSRS